MSRPTHQDVFAPRLGEFFELGGIQHALEFLAGHETRLETLLHLHGQGISCILNPTWEIYLDPCNSTKRFQCT